MHPARIRKLNDASPDPDGSYVLYWMQQSQRAHANPALEHAVRLADDLDVGLIVGFGLMANYPEANRRHFAFMLEGLAESAESLHRRGIKLVARTGEPHRVALDLARGAAAVVCDRGYLRHQREWRREVAARAGKLVVQVEGDVVVPVTAASDKREYAARTLRPKINRLRDEFLERLTETGPHKSSLPLAVTGEIDPRQPDAVLDALCLDNKVDRSHRFRGGTTEARRKLERFIRNDLEGYAEARNDPGNPQCSEMSPYLHFGQISPVEIALKVKAAKSGSREDKEAFLEELVVRRELAVNYVFFEPDYDAYKSIPGWARETLERHEEDRRPHRYTRGQLETAETHDPAWNAAMREMTTTGYMHNYMRMYWGKKIIEWTGTPAYAFDTALYLNNKYFLDGRDPAGYANVAWLFGLHDRPWRERAVFGKVRYMSAAGLRGKFDLDAYIRRVDKLSGQAE